MIYSAIVLSNTSYFTTGTIRVRVFSYYISPRFTAKNEPISIDDLSTKPEMIDEGKWKDPETGETKEGPNYPNQDFNAWVFSTMGGGKNYGLFHLPQVNERGIVAFLDGDIHKPIWLGSYFEPVIDPTNYQNQIIKEINVPNDNPSAEGNVTSAFDKDQNTKGLSGDPNSIVLRTKHTELVPQGNTYKSDKIDWSKRDSENLVVLGNDIARLRHFSDIENNTTINKYQEIIIARNPGDSKEFIQLDVNNIKDNKRGLVTLTENGFTIVLHGSSGDLIWTVSSGDTGIHFIDQFGNRILGNTNGLFITGANNISITDNSGDTILLASNKIIVNANNEVDLVTAGSQVSDFFVKYSYLKEIIEKFETHTHITQGPSGPTTAAMDSAGAPGIGTVITQQKNQMKTNDIKVDDK